MRRLVTFSLAAGVAAVSTTAFAMQANLADPPTKWEDVPPASLNMSRSAGVTWQASPAGEAAVLPVLTPAVAMRATTTAPKQLGSAAGAGGGMHGGGMHGGGMHGEGMHGGMHGGHMHGDHRGHARMAPMYAPGLGWGGPGGGWTVQVYAPPPPPPPMYVCANGYPPPPPQGAYYQNGPDGPPSGYDDDDDGAPPPPPGAAPPPGGPPPGADAGPPPPGAPYPPPPPGAFYGHYGYVPACGPIVVTETITITKSTPRYDKRVRFERHAAPPPPPPPPAGERG